MRVWQALNDTAILKACIHGCTRIEWVNDTTLEAEMHVQLGPVGLDLGGDITLSDIIVAERYTLTGRARGGWLGWAHGAADVALSDLEHGTGLEFTAHGDVASTLARLGSVVVGGAAQRIIDGFFERFAGTIGATSTPMHE